MSRSLTVNALRRKISVLPRVRLAELPTPLMELPRFSEALNGPRIFMKRDDLTGLAFGGNKTRMFEFLLADALRQGADTIVGGAGVQSNYARQLVAACNVLRLEAHLILRRLSPEDGEEIQGNLLLDLLAGARVRIIEADAEKQRQRMFEYAEELRNQGRIPYVVRMADTSNIDLDVLSYTNCFCEIVEQCRSTRISPTHLYACSYDSTQSGLELGRLALGEPMKIVGIAAESRPERSPELIEKYVKQAAERIGVDGHLPAEEVENSGAYIGPAYGVPSEAGREALLLLARTEGIFLDPVYSSKSMAALIDHVRRGILGPQDVVVFLHTGGTPALFALTKEIVTPEVRSLLTYE